MNRETFSGVIRDHHPALCAYARVITGDGFKADEIVQDAFITAWQNIDKFDVTRDLSGWLRGIIRNKWKEACRKARREVTVDESCLEALENAAIEIRMDQPEVFDRLHACRSKLPQALNESVTAYYDEQLSSDEAAAHLEIQPATLRKRLERARMALLKCLKGETPNHA